MAWLVVQQGDPLGSLLYCLSTVELHRNLHRNYIAISSSYLDDDASGGPYQHVLDDFVTLEGTLRSTGLHVNVAKCEVFLSGETAIERHEAAVAFGNRFPLLKEIPGNKLVHLGAPLLDEAFSEELEAVSRKGLNLVNKCKVLQAHHAVFLIKNCPGPIKLVYLQRTCRTFCFPELLHSFEEQMRQCLCTVINRNVSGTAWMQAGLPVSSGGLGIREAKGLALPAFLASVYSALTLSQRISPFNLDDYLGTSPELWKTASGSELPDQENRKTQQCWDLSMVNAIRRLLMELLVHDPTARARLLVAATREPGAYLEALPIASLSNFLDDRLFGIAIALRLGIETNAPHRCVCDSWANSMGYHALSCSTAMGRLSRHASLNVIVQRAFGKAGIFCELEPSSLMLHDGRRPDGQTIMPVDVGNNVIWDSTCVCTMAIHNIGKTLLKAGVGAEAAEVTKIDKYRAFLPNDEFVPLRFETLGSRGPEATALLERTAKKQFVATGENRSLQSLRQRVSVEIQRGNAICVLGTLPEARQPVF